MNRRTSIVAGAVAVGLVLAILGLLAMNRRQRLEAAAPAWLNPDQPPDGVAAQLSTLTDAQSWAANRCRPMSACCAANTAGSRVRRQYPSTLACSPGSFIRGGLELEARVN